MKPSFLQDLKERKLVQWAIAYLAGAWVVFEVSDAVGGRWGLPDVVYQGLFILLVVGFFVTMVLTWYHGEKGRQRVSGPELMMIALLLVLAGTGMSLLRGGGGAPETVTPAGEPEHPRTAIAVLPFQNLSADGPYAYFASGLHDELLTQLAKVAALSVRGRTSVMGYAGTDKSIKEVGQELEVARTASQSTRELARVGI